jgi:putative colanic acid biosynthesis acetyltransferase WcaF
MISNALGESQCRDITKEPDKPDSESIRSENETTSPTRCLYQDLTLFRTPSGFRGRGTVVVQLWWVVQETLFRWSPQALFGWRSLLLRLFGAQIGKNVRLRPTVRVTYPWKLSSGDNVWIGDDCVLYNLAEIKIGSHVALAHRVYLCTGFHDYTRLDFAIQALPIQINDEVWLTNDVFIGPGVTVGLGAVVGARSTVLNDLPGGTVSYGCPAKPVKSRLPARS